MLNASALTITLAASLVALSTTTPAYAQSTPSATISEQPPQQLPYQDGPTPKGYVLEHRTHYGLWISGTATLLSGWVPFLIGGGMYGYDSSVVPLVGPWLNFAKKDQDSGGRVASAALGGVQAVGAGLIVAGLLIDNPRFVRADLADVEVGPMVGLGELGLQVSGRY